jgi:hypothetical protein
MKSPQLRKYRDIYEIISKLKIKKTVSFNPKKNSVKIMTPERTPDRTPERITEKNEKKNKKPLNSYQKFIQTESLKTKYKKISPKSRMKSIANEWKKKKAKT